MKLDQSKDIFAWDVVHRLLDEGQIAQPASSCNMEQCAIVGQDEEISTEPDLREVSSSSTQSAQGGSTERDQTSTAG